MNSRSNRKLHNLMKVNSLFLEGRPEINASLTSSYLAAAISRPINDDKAKPQKDLSKLTDLPYTTMSHHLRYPGDKARQDKEGML